MAYTRYCIDSGRVMILGKHSQVKKQLTVTAIKGVFLYYTSSLKIIHNTSCYECDPSREPLTVKLLYVLWP